MPKLMPGGVRDGAFASRRRRLNGALAVLDVIHRAAFLGE